MDLLLYLASNLSLVVSSYFVSYNSYSLYDRIIKTFVVYITFLLHIVLVLGLLFRKLSIYSVTGLSLIIGVLICIFFYRKSKNKIIPNIFSDIRYIATFGYFKNLRNKYFKYIVYSVSAVVIFKFIINFIFLPVPSDGTWYHLPNLVDYIQAGKIYFSEKPLWSNCFPKNIEMLNLWQLIFFRSGLYFMQYLERTD